MELPTPPKNPSVPIEVPPGAPALPGVFGIVGARGQGKTHVTCQLIRKYVNFGSINRVFLISPTYATNEHLWRFCGIQPEDAYVNIDQAEAALKDVVRKIGVCKAGYDAHKAYVDAKTKLRAGAPLSVAERLMLESPAPAAMRLIRPAVVLDDLSHSKLMTSSKYLVNLTLRSRHVASNPQVGLSMFFLVQSLKSGIPRTLRSNVSTWLAFGTKDRTILDDLYQELSGKIDRPAFNQLFHESTAGRHDYLVVDLTAGDPSRVFRKRL